jgi:uncharacterized protein
MNDDFTRAAALFRTRREEGLRAPFGWLSVVSMVWLDAGESRVGADPAAEVPLPRRAGVPGTALRLFPLGGGRIRVTVEPGVIATHAGARFTRVELAPNPHGFDTIELPGLAIELLARGERFAVRVKDAEAPARSRAAKLPWFPSDPRWVVRARLEPAAPGATLAITSVLGDVDHHPTPGIYRFEIDGRACALTPVLQSPTSTTLFFMFRDRTSGRSSYGAGRFLFAERSGDTVTLDFNRAVSPPCAYTPHATCPVPPACNVLDVAIEAGEMSPPEIEPATQADAEELLALQRLCYQGEAERYDDFTIPPLTQTLESLRADIETGPVLVARHGGELVGSVRAHLDGARFHIGRLIVHPTWRGRGLGPQLLAAIEALAAPGSTLEVYTGHRSEEFLRLYQRHGYARAKTVTVHPRLDLVYLDKQA